MKTAKPIHAYADTTLARAGLVLQRTCACGGSAGPTGECAECRRKRLLQPRLTVNTPGDKYEQEADRVAEQVMRIPEEQLSRAPLAIQRLAGPVQRMEAEEEEKETLQMKAGAANGAHAEAPPVVHDVLRSPGRALDARTSGFMESRFGHDFSRVRVHTGGVASASARAVQARAYTVGRDIVFEAGQYAPTTEAGRRLLAHELTHVVQQTQGGARPSIQRVRSFGTGTHTTGGGNTLREITEEEKKDSNGFKAALAVVDRLATGADYRAKTCQQWFVDNCTVARTLKQLNDRAILWMWREADGSSGNGVTDSSARQNHATTEQLFKKKSFWALAATIIHEYWHDCETACPACTDIGDDAKAACGLPNI